MKYDSNYNLVEESYYNTNNEPASIKANDYHMIKYEYNNLNKIISKKYFDIQGKLIRVNKYNNIGADTRIKYDNKGNIIEESYHNINGNLILSDVYLLYSAVTSDSKNRLLFNSNNLLIKSIKPLSKAAIPPQIKTGLSICLPESSLSSSITPSLKLLRTSSGLLYARYS